MTSNNKPSNANSPNINKGSSHGLYGIYSVWRVYGHILCVDIQQHASESGTSTQTVIQNEGKVSKSLISAGKNVARRSSVGMAKNRRKIRRNTATSANT